MRHLEKRALSLLLALLLCITLFPAAALAEEGSIRPVENEENGGLSGTPAPTEEDEPGTIVGDGVLDVPSDDPAALPQEPSTDEIQGIVASGSCGEYLTWTLDDAGVLTISGEGEMTDWNGASSIPWFGLRESIMEIRIDVGVTSIGSWAFWGCNNLTRVAIPEDVTSIGRLAFIRCSSLTSITIPASVTSIGSYAFAECSGLMTVTIPDSVTSIGDGAFAGCSNLLEFLVAEGNKAYASVDGVLYDLNVQTLIQCPGGKLGEFTIPESVTSIGDGAFNSCSSLTSVQIPEGVTSIGYNAFSGCSALTSVTIPASVTNIPQSPFRECSSLQEILVAKGNKDYASIAGVLYDASIQTLIQCPGGKTGEIAIPESVTSIGYYAFDGCSSLTSVTIPDGVISIGGGAFGDCTSLKTIIFQGDALTIRESTFNNDRATVFYPIDNPTWTADKLQNYGGTLTWVGYRDEAKAYTIHFDANGGSNAPEDQIKGHNVDLLLTEAVPTREEASFLGWSTRRGAREPDYLPGDSFGLNADTTLYAVWKRNAPVLPTEAVLTLGSARLCAGQEFTVDLTMEKNPGLMYLSFRLDYDADALAFLGAEDGAFSGWMVNTEKSFLTWDSDEDRTENGVLLRLRFRAKEEAPTGETAIALADLFATNYAEELLGIGSVPGTVAILPHTPGDVNGDGEVDGRDLVRLRKYLTGDTGEEAIEANANVNGDDVIDILDLIRLRKYLAQEDVILE